LLWHQALDAYTDPERFRANLNATLQALRNITFAIQSEKSLIPDFARWYERWQVRLAGDPTATWVKNSRNRIVKQGELETSSKAIVRLVSWKDEILTEIEVPPSLPPSLILANLPLVSLIGNAKLYPGDVADGAVTIERSWSVPDLGGREILDALAHVYGLLSELVLDAHLRLEKIACIPSDHPHADFVSKYQRTGLLECMALAIETRTSRFTLGGEHMVPATMAASLGVSLSEAAARYGLAQGDRIAAWEEMDPLLVADRILFMAKRMLRRDRFHARIIFVRDGAGQWHQLGFVARDRTEKHLIMRLVAALVARTGADALIDVGEIWTLSEDTATTLTNVSSLESVPGRGEALHLLVATREGALKTFKTPFTRGPLGGIKLQDTVVMDKEAPYYLQPIFEVWRRQGVIKNKSGENIRWMWEPDALDGCFCGKPLRFGECCKRLIIDPDERPDLRSRFEEAIAQGDATTAEKCASAALAQYIIWIKQHTAPTRLVAEELHRGLLEVDIPALDAYIHQLEEALEAAGLSETFLERLRHIARIIGVPELSVRVTARAAKFALETGDRVTAVAELERLGDLDRVHDTLALLVAAGVFAGSPTDERSFLTRAVSFATTPSERSFAELQLARHFKNSEKPSDAMAIVDGLVASAEGKSEMAGLLGEALALRWEVSKRGEDFDAAKRALQSLVGPMHQRDLVLLLMQHGDLSEATQLLQSIDAADLVGSLLRIEILLRTSAPYDAKKEFERIAPDTVPARLRHPYLHTMALVALDTSDAGLQAAALKGLESLVPIGAEVALVETMIQSLRSALHKT
jgi:hypothetical protein